MASNGSGQLFYRPVYLFAHRNPSAATDLLAITAKFESSSSSNTIELSPMHYIPICTSGCDDVSLSMGGAHWKNKFAKDVRLGDIIMMKASFSNLALQQGSVMRMAKVEYISRKKAIGLFSPLIRGANIVIDGIVASPHANSPRLNPLAKFLIGVTGGQVSEG